VRVNGAGAHLVDPSDVVIIATFTELDGAGAKKHQPPDYAGEKQEASNSGSV